MAPKTSREKREKGSMKRSDANPQDVMGQLSALIRAAKPDLGTEIPNRPALAMFNQTRPFPKRSVDHFCEPSSVRVIFDPSNKRNRRARMSVEGSSSTSLHVIDINASKRDRYEHLVPVMKSMEHSVNREWGESENRADDIEVLGLCTDLSNKVNMHYCPCLFICALFSLFFFQSLIYFCSLTFCWRVG